MEDEKLTLNSINMNKTDKEHELVFPEFEDIRVSTKTFIAMTNLIIDLKKLFDFLPITEYIVVPKKRGRKKKTEQAEPIRNISTVHLL